MSADYFDARERALIASAEAAGILGSGIARGRAREALLRDYVREHVPSRIRPVGGETVDSFGRTAGESDIVLLDHDSAAATVGGDSVVPVEAAVAVIEVKSSLIGAGLESAVRKIAAVKALERTPHHGFYRPTDGSRVPVPPASTNGYVVGFRGPALPTICRRLAENLEWVQGDYLRFGPDIIAILGSGFVYKNDNHIFATPPGGEGWTLVTREDAGTRAIFGHVQEYLSRYGALAYELTAYYE